MVEDDILFTVMLFDDQGINVDSAEHLTLSTDTYIYISDAILYDPSSIKHTSI